MYIRIACIFLFMGIFKLDAVAYVAKWQQEIRERGEAIQVLPDVFYGQWGQDKFIYEKYFKDKKDGFFVEFGAADGIFISNSLFFEKTLGWDGILIEPIPHYYDQLVKNRSATCIQGCISDRQGELTFLQVGMPDRILNLPTVSEDLMLWSGILENMPFEHIDRIQKHLNDTNGYTTEYPVPCYLLNDILEQYQVPRIDYLSIDVECGELEVLQSIDFDKYDIDVIGVEGNFQSKEIKEFLVSMGYEHICYLGDYIFKKIYN